MNFSEREHVEADTVNVVSLFGKLNHQEVIFDDPLENLLLEAGVLDPVIAKAPVAARRVVNQNQFPDQSIYVLEEQLASLRISLNKLKFYLGDIDDLIPR
jgi:hypothetical protein